MAPMKSIKLNDGNSIPILGFGTGTSQAFGDCSGVVTQALGIGYRHLDCAWWYKNQQHTGAAIAQAISASQNTISPLDSGHGCVEDVPSLELEREDLFITTKGGDFHADPESFNAKTFLDQCLSDLGVDYVDLYLLHADILVQADVTVAWRQMEQIRREGFAKSIGVSNFSTKSLQAIIDDCEIVPAMNQIEFHPYSLPHYLPTLLPLCKEHSIVIECYAPLMSITRHIGGPVDEAVAEVIKARAVEPTQSSSALMMAAEETAAQILLMWAQQGSQGLVLTTTGKVDRMISHQAPFLQDSPIEPLSPTHIDLITQAGLQAPYRKFGQGWPFFMQGEGGIQACPLGSTHRNGPKDPLSKDHLK